MALVLNAQSFLERMKNEYHEACSQFSSINEVESFSQRVRELSSQNMGFIRALIAEKIHELNDSSVSVAVALTGSDGRLEKGCFSSKAELIVITAVPDESLSLVVLESIAKIKQLVLDNSCLFFEGVEKKQLNTEEKVSVFMGRKISYVPTRAFDSQFILGSVDVFVEYKKQLYNELKADSKINVLFKKMFVKEAEKVLFAEWRAMQSPTKRSPVKPNAKLLGVDVIKGVVQTDGEYVKGPKYGILRIIQYSVASKIFSSPMTQADFMQIPSTVAERIDWLRDKNIVNLTAEECDRLKQYYRLGSFWYSRLQDEAIVRGGATKDQVISISIDSGLLRTVITKTKELILKMQQEKCSGKTEVVQQELSPSKRQKVSYIPK